MSEKKERRPILYNGQIYSEPITKGGGGGEKAMKFTFEEARDAILKDISQTKSVLRQMPSTSRLPNEVVLSLTMLPDFTAKSYYPDTLFDLETERFGLKEIGSRIYREEKTVIVDSEEVIESTTSKMFFVRATEESLESFEKFLNNHTSTHTKKFQNDIRKLSSFGFLQADEQIVGLPEGWDHGRLEAVLHPFDLDSNITLEHFLNKIREAGANDNEIRYKQYSTGVTFVSFSGNSQMLESISGYNPLRTVHPLKMRELPDFSRGTLVNGGPVEPVFTVKPSTVVGVIDGGVHPNNPFLMNYTESEFPVAGNPVASLLDHGTQVTGAVLYGPLNKYANSTVLQEPQISVKSFGVLTDAGGADPELYDIIDAIEVIIPNNPDISVYNLSLGPKGPILDDSISRFTYACDLLSYQHGVLFCVAVGNDGDMPGYDRIQSPSDAVNCLGIGAYSKVDGIYSRAYYSSIGPGREGSKMKPDLMAFGGCNQNPIHLISNESGKRVWNLGTSFASPIVAGIAGRLIGESNNVINSLTAKTLLIHSALEKTNGHNVHMGHGIIPDDFERITTCGENSYTLIYRGEIETSKYAEFLIPWENIQQGKVKFQWTAAVLTDVDHLSSDDYTSSAIEVAFYPNRNKFLFKNATGNPLDGITKKSEIVDIALDPERAEYLSENGWERGAFPQTGSVESQYKKEAELRADLKWDSLDTKEVSKFAKNISEPTFHIHALGRGSRNSGAKVKFALVLTVTTSSAEIDLYDTILNKYSALIPLQLMTEVQNKFQTKSENKL
jgi:hypothetical protein